MSHHDLERRCVMTPVPRSLLKTALNVVADHEDVSVQIALTYVFAELRRLGDELGADVSQALDESYDVYVVQRKDPIVSDDQSAISDVLRHGFIVLTLNLSNEPDSRLEALGL